jgi:hypothetical protein
MSRLRRSHLANAPDDTLLNLWRDGVIRQLGHELVKPPHALAQFLSRQGAQPGANNVDGVSVQAGLQPLPDGFVHLPWQGDAFGLRSHAANMAHRKKAVNAARRKSQRQD